jgi:hypothetical protein
MTRLLHARQSSRIRQINAIQGLVHPHTEVFDSFEEHVSVWRRYGRLIQAVADDPESVLVFVGTATTNSVEKLRKLDPETGRRLTHNLPLLRDSEREKLACDMRAAGIYVREGARFGFLEELSLLYSAATSIGPERFLYFEGDVSGRVLKERLGGRIDPLSVSVSFTGEKPDVCVREREEALCSVLGIPKQQLKII